MTSNGPSRRHWALTIGVAALVAWTGIGLGAMQDQPAQKGRPRPVPEKKNPGGLRLPPTDKAKTEPGAGVDPLTEPPKGAAGAAGPAPKADEKAAAPQGPPVWPYHYSLQIRNYDGQPTAARYYPAQNGPPAPVLLMVHEIGPGRSGRDFEDPIAELKGKSLAAYLQEEGYAVLVLDLRGHGENPKRALEPEQWRALAADLQAAYHFLIDRHNRRELNLGKFGVLGLGEGANLAAYWASRPGGAVSVQGRLSDLASLVLISPLADDRGLRLAPLLATLAPRFPILLMSSEGDALSSDAVKASQQVVERQRLSRVALVEGRQHGANLLRFTPGATKPLLNFLENTLENRTDDWEPRYNLDPVSFSQVRLVDPRAARPKAEEAPKAEEPKAEAKKSNGG